MDRNYGFMTALIRDILDPKRLPWVHLVTVALAALLVAVVPLRDYFVYDRAAIANWQLWRIWTGHIVHFGWPHGFADGSLFVLLGWYLQRTQKVLSYWSLVILPAVVSLSLFWFDPQMAIYGGLSGVNVGLLVYLACRGWQRNLWDWFWPAILLIHVIELWIEVRYHGTGGGAIRFDNSNIHVATVAHVGGAVYGVAAWGAQALLARGIQGQSGSL